jgi:hypothetical protein
MADGHKAGHILTACLLLANLSGRMARDSRVDALQDKLGNLASDVKALKETKSPDGLLKRNAVWVAVTSAVIAAVVLLFGNGLASWLMGLIVDARIDAKLEQPIKDLAAVKIDVAKLVVRMEMRDTAALDSQAFKRDLNQVGATL